MTEEAKDQLPASLHLFMQAYMRYSVADMTQSLQDYNLSMPQVGSLHHLRAEGAQSVSQIAQYLGLSLTATSHLVERLVKRDLVKREEDPLDRRQKRVTLAPAGSQLLEEMHQRAAKGFKEMLEPLSPDLQRRFGETLEEVVNVLGLNDWRER